MEGSIHKALEHPRHPPARPAETVNVSDFVRIPNRVSRRRLPDLKRSYPY
jgi:hypothetical protein